MSKPREWWFNVTWNGEYSQPLEDGPVTVNDEDEVCRVIEKSAYDDIAEELQICGKNLQEGIAAFAKLRAELEELKIHLQLTNEGWVHEFKHAKQNAELRVENAKLMIEKAEFDLANEILCDRIEKLRAENAELVEALKVVYDISNDSSVVYEARQALAKHGGGE